MGRQGLTSTSSRMVTTNTSSVEFLQPTTTPVRSDLRMSVGQNTLINPSCSTMTKDGYRQAQAQHSEGASSPELFSSRYAGSVFSRVLPLPLASIPGLSSPFPQYRWMGVQHTSLVSLLASRATGTKMARKKTVKTTMPRATRN